MSEKRRSVGIVLGMAAIAVIVIGYVWFYFSPALRYAGRIFPQTAAYGEGCTYEKDGYEIRIQDSPFVARIDFSHSAEEAAWAFYVTRQDYTVTAYGLDRKPLLSGLWRGGKLCDESHHELPAYADMKARSRAGHFQPEAADAIYVYKTCADATRGGKRAPMLLLMAVVCWLMFWTQLDARPAGERKRLWLTTALLDEYGKPERSPTAQGIDRMVMVSVALLAAVCIGILIFDVLCY